jgi:hypothetical protein
MNKGGWQEESWSSSGPRKTVAGATAKAFGRQVQSATDEGRGGRAKLE